MADRRTSQPSKPRPVPGSHSTNISEGRSSVPESTSRTTSTARLASPVPSGGGIGTGTPNVRQAPASSQLNSGTQTPLAGAEASDSLPGPGRSALATALQGTLGGSPPRFGTPPMRSYAPGSSSATPQASEQPTTYGSFSAQSNHGAQGPNEDAEVVKRHLVQPSYFAGQGEQHRSGRNSLPGVQGSSKAAFGHDRKTSETRGIHDGEFSSLQLQGGDITRELYRWSEDAEAESATGGRSKRSKSFNIFRPQPDSEILDINSILVPGGFRRDHLRRRAASPLPIGRGHAGDTEGEGRLNQGNFKPRLFTNNFIEFLTLYGHFAGEQLEEDDEDLEPDEYFASDDIADFYQDSGDDSEREPGEGSALLTPRTPGGRRRKPKERTNTGQNGPTGATLLLLKSFVGTGVLFLPKAYLNGGMLFSNLVLLFVALLSYYCYYLLVKTRLQINGSFGDIGGVVYGRFVRNLILTSVVLSQMGFVAAYIVFTAENLQAFVLAVSRCREWISIKFFILMQMGVFLPLSLIRDITKLGVTALIADFFILLGLIYLYYYDIRTIVSNHGVADIVQFNPRDWTLFIGTAIFTFEGIGLIIPIQESMKRPSQLPSVLAFVMVIITTIFLSMGAISYAAYGSSTKTVILLNMPQDDKFVNAVQLLYSLAILLSTPLQLFPAIRIMENELFTRSGKYNPHIKWQKNLFRFFLVI
ncbi:MAG: hypothetical protein Q9187_004055, partial [Circinaria calcarea]